VELSQSRAGLTVVIRKWMSRLLGVLYPQNNSAGKLANIRTSQMPDQQSLVSQGLPVLRTWIKDAFYSLDPSNTNQVLELFLIASGMYPGLCHLSRSDIVKAIDHYGVPQYFLEAYDSIAEKMPSVAYCVDNKGGNQPLVIDLYNALFAQVDRAMSNGAGYIRLFVGTWGYILLLTL